MNGTYIFNICCRFERECKLFYVYALGRQNIKAGIEPRCPRSWCEYYIDVTTEQSKSEGAAVSNLNIFAQGYYAANHLLRIFCRH